MKCTDCGSSKAYKRKGVAWRLCRPCWNRLLGTLAWANAIGEKTTAVSIIEKWEHTCPACGAVTERHSIDGGMTSRFYGECGHSWRCDPFAKGGKELVEP